MQSSLAVASGLAGIYSFTQTQQWLWVVGAIVILANWPFTLIVIMPVNKKLIATKEADINNSTVDLIKYWGKLHSVRTVLGILATIIFVFALL